MTFLDQLLDEGHVRVADGGLGTDAEIGQTLATFEREYRQHLPGEPPAFQSAAAVWGARLLYELLLGLVDRSTGEAELAAAVSPELPDPIDASVAYSVDLALRFLPDVSRLARAASENDPLHAHLKRIAADWPLSSVGVPDIELPADHPAIDHVILPSDCLRMLYVDRVIAHSDVGRLANPDVRAAARAVAGNVDLASPVLTSALRDEPPAAERVITDTNPLTTTAE